MPGSPISVVSRQFDNDDAVGGRGSPNDPSSYKQVPAHLEGTYQTGDKAMSMFKHRDDSPMPIGENTLGSVLYGAGKKSAPVELPKAIGAE